MTYVTSKLILLFSLSYSRLMGLISPLVITFTALKMQNVTRATSCADYFELVAFFRNLHFWCSCSQCCEGQSAAACFWTVWFSWSGSTAFWTALYNDCVLLLNANNPHVLVIAHLNWIWFLVHLPPCISSVYYSCLVVVKRSWHCHPPAGYMSSLSVRWWDCHSSHQSWVNHQNLSNTAVFILRIWRLALTACMCYNIQLSTYYSYMTEWLHYYS